LHTAVVELDALADAVGTGAQDHHALAVAAAQLVLLLVGRVVLRGLRLDLGGAAVDSLVDGSHAGVAARLAHGSLGGADQLGDAGVGDAEAAQAPPSRRVRHTPRGRAA